MSVVTDILLISSVGDLQAIELARSFRLDQIDTTVYPPATSIHWYDGDKLTGNKLMADLDKEQCCGCGEHVLCVALRDKINPDECWCYHLCPSCLRAMANKLDEAELIPGKRKYSLIDGAMMEDEQGEWTRNEDETQG